MRTGGSWFESEQRGDILLSSTQAKAAVMPIVTTTSSRSNRNAIKTLQYKHAIF